MITEKEEWGNLTLPGMTHEELMDPNLNRKLAAREVVKRKSWRKNNLDAITKPETIAIKRKNAKKQWKKGRKNAVKKMAESMTNVWKDPDYREKQKQSRYEQYNVPEKTANYKGALKGVCKKTGKVIIVHGAKQLVDLGFTPANVYACILGKRKSANGYVWTRYKGESK